MEHLVVVVPGIGGSVLADASGTVWDAGLGEISGLIMNPERLDMNAVPELTATGLITSKRLLAGWAIVHGYETLMSSLGGLKGARVDQGDPAHPDLVATVAAVPYDFRRSIVDAAEALAANVKARLDALGAGSGDRRVIVVAHSLGGLVARYWLGPLEGWRCCRALITLGTPHRGAPKALAWLVNGVHVGPLVLSGATALVRGWPSVFELLPRYPVVWDEVAGLARYPHDLPIGWFAGPATRAFGVHADIERAWMEMPRQGPEMVAMLGWSHPTLLSARWDGTLRVSKMNPGWVEARGWERDLGDGTVPAVSSVPLEMAGAQRGLIRVRERHGPLVASRSVADLVGEFEVKGSTVAVRGEEHQPALGLDLDDAYMVGEALRLEVQLHRCQPSADTEVWVTVRAPGANGRTRVRLDVGDDGVYSTGELVVGEAGLHDVEVLAIGLPGAGDLVVTDSFAGVRST